MLRHIVLFRRNPGGRPDHDKEQALTARMAGLGSQIPAVRKWFFAPNELQRAISWDYVLEAEVDDAQALDAYLFHPLHQALVADLKPYFEWAAVDYTAP
ncbi:Dabb family protein [Candidimonas nitroreducens]|uniref:Stress protein n=1 Tax=Candidimonas nitroreducens TaxID=683354 RepID=A0A225N2T3_9BURK|nr:Dabb family protein [Candidimonas nitroreducens]OWT66181.1 stress protein [Candidimonas nitroreducens]